MYYSRKINNYVVNKGSYAFHCCEMVKNVTIKKFGGDYNKLWCQTEVGGTNMNSW